MAWRRRAPGHLTGPRRAALAIAAFLTAIAVAAAACSPGPTTAPTDTPDQGVPILPTPWANGTTGQYGLRIDPSLLARLPKTVDAYPLTEDAFTESLDMDDPDLAKAFDSYAAANIGAATEDDWLYATVGHFKPDLQSPAVWSDTYETWVDQYAGEDCSQADGVSGTNQETINGWIVDEATCSAGPVVYTLSLGQGVILSMLGSGPNDLGRKLIEAIYT